MKEVVITLQIAGLSNGSNVPDVAPGVVITLQIAGLSNLVYVVK